MSENFGYRAFDEGVRQFTIEEWLEILQDSEITKAKDWELIDVIFQSENYVSNATEIGKRLGYSRHNPVNKMPANWVKRMEKKHDVKLSFTENGKPKY